MSPPKALSNDSIKFSKNLIKQVKKESKQIIKKNIFKSSFILLLKLTIFLCTFFSFLILIYSIFGINFVVAPVFKSLFYYLSLARDTNKDLLIIMSATSFCLFYILGIPLKYGALKWFWYVLYEKKACCSKIFFYYSNFSKFFRSFLFHTSLNFIKLLYLLICLCPGIAFFIFACIKMQTAVEFNHKVIFAGLILLSFILIFACYVLYRIVTMKYMFASKFFTLNENLSIRKALKISAITVKKNRLNIIRFFLSFSLLFISCIFILPIFFIFPYFNLAFCFYSNKLPIKPNKKLKKSLDYTKINLPNCATVISLS